MTLLGLLTRTVATASGDIGGGFWMPPDASTVAGEVDRVFDVILWICIFFFVLIVALMVHFTIKYRRREGEKAEGGATHNTPLELTWTIIPLILVIVIFYVGLEGYVDLVTAPKNAYEVNVTAQRWSWTFNHRNGAAEVGEITVPAGRPVKLVMSSEDVLHSLFIPAFRVKQDVVPGRYTYLWFEANEPGDYQLFCTEYCGTEHSQMNATVHVLPAEQFESAIAQKAAWIDDIAEADLYNRAGPRIYARYASCHSVDGSTKTGPSLQQTHSLWGKERVFADGRSKVVDENYIRNSILNPAGDVVANYPNQMPSFKGQLKEKEVRAMIEMIKRLDEVYDDQGNLIAAE